MSLFFDALVIYFLLVLFGYSHTLLASFEIKERLAGKIGDKMAFYRLFYNISSILIFVAIYGIAPKPKGILYDLPNPWDIVVYVLQALSLIGLFWSAYVTDLKEFLGISQVIRYMKGTYDAENLDEDTGFKVTGPYRYSRHPLYLFSILFLGLRPVMTYFYFFFFIGLTAYFIAGSIYEERKLVRKFGVQYQLYREKVPAFVPYKIFKRDKSL